MKDVLTANGFNWSTWSSNWTVLGGEIQNWHLSKKSSFLLFQKSKCGEWISLISEDSRTFFLQKCRTVVSVYLPEAVVAVGVGSLVRIPLKSFVGTNVKVCVENDRLSKRSSQLFSILARDFANTPPCEHFDHGKNYLLTLICCHFSASSFPVL